MPTDSPAPHFPSAARQEAAVGPTHGPTTGSCLDWPAILAGAGFALALAFVLISFGGTFGLSLSSPYRGEGVSAAWPVIAAAIWVAWVMVTSLGAGGSLAGRMRRRAGDATGPEVALRNGAQGLMVRATSVVVSPVPAAMGTGVRIGIGASAMGSTWDAAGETVEATDPAYLADVMVRGMDAPDQPAAPENADAAGGLVSEGPTAGTTAAATPQRQTSEQTARPQSIDPAIQQQIATIILRSVASGEMVERDRRHLAQVVAAKTDPDPIEAQASVEEVNAERAETRTRALDTVETTRMAGGVCGFNAAAATLPIGAIAAFVAATAAGRHRDEGPGFDVPMKRL